MDTDHGGSTKYPLMAKEWKLSEFKRLTAFAQQLADPEHKAHALSYLENHDQVRSLPSAFSQRRSERRRLTLPHHLPSHPPFLPLLPLDHLPPPSPLSQARSVSRFASDAPEHRLASSKLLSTYLLTLSGSIIIYQGRASSSSSPLSSRSAASS